MKRYTEPPEVTTSWMNAVFLALILCTASSAAQGQQPSAEQLQPGSVSGTVVDASGAVVANSTVLLSQPGSASQKQSLTDDSGHFRFGQVSPGLFDITVTASGFAAFKSSATLHPAQDLIVPQITLLIAQADVDVEVTLPIEQVAEDQVKEEEKQKVFGIVPNYYVSYVPNAAPLTPRLKFHLARKLAIDPTTFLITGAAAGLEQAQDLYGGYGPGAAGYARRYGAAYGDLVSSIFIGGALLPSLFKQDPRYFYKGTGSTRSRIEYAIAMSVMCKGDNGHRQLNYSAIIGGLASGAISNLYYSPQDRNGARLTFQNEALGTVFGAAGNIIQEFFLKRLTPAPASRNPTQN